MNCPYCGAPVSGQPQYCPSCGGKLPDVPQEPPRPTQPLLGMILGIISVVLAFFAYLASVISSASGRGFGIVILLLVIPALGLGVESLILSITGMKRSIHTGGRKYVKGIVFSSVGIACSATALVLLIFTIFFGILLSALISRYG